jgi:hypothetical protein
MRGFVVENHKTVEILTSERSWRAYRLARREIYAQVRLQALLHFGAHGDGAEQT